MGIPIQAIEESLSIAYVGAVVARAGATYDLVRSDYGVDVRVARIDSLGGKRMDMGVAFELQLKASIKWAERDNQIVYDLDADTYNKLIHRDQNSSTPCFLVLLCLPEDSLHWVQCSESALELRRCCYYLKIRGAPTSNNSSVRITIPRTQRLTPEVVEDLIERVRRREVL